MTLIVDTRLKHPATHVVLIGVGDYPYLKGGAQRRKLFEHHENMGQLRSPPHSVVALADWFASHLANPDRPLGSLEMLVSGGPAAYSLPGRKKKVKLQAADLGRVEVALRAWADRCDRNPDNLAVFYFCGHGVVSGQEQSLLLQNFGQDTGSPFRDALAFSQFRVGMRSRRVRNQCFFVDACRSVSETYLLTYGQNFVGTPVISGALTAALPGTQSQVFFASELGSAAYGRDGRPSVFAEGLLAALNGMAASQDDDGWTITTSRLAEAINAHATTQVLLQPMPEQLCVSDGVAAAVPLHRLAAEPQVPVLVACQPTEATPQAAFSCLRNGQQVANGTCGRRPAWRTDLAPDRYDFRAAFPARPRVFADGQSPMRFVMPPSTRVTIQATKVRGS
jgi:hypothetical protein